MNNFIKCFKKSAAMNLNQQYYVSAYSKSKMPSSIYSWSIGHILEHEFFCLGHLGCAGSKGKKVDLSFSEQLLRVVFSILCGEKDILFF